MKKIALLMMLISGICYGQDTTVEALGKQPPGGGGGGGDIFVKGTLPEPDLDRTLIPLSPDVAAFERYGNVEVNQALGLPNITIPLFQGNAGKLPVNINLNYSYSGLKPTETAGWVGLGWNLSPGGVITRVVKGELDEGTNVNGRRVDDVPDFSLYANNQLVLDEINLKIRDGEYDIYSYQIPGHSGKFIIKNGYPILFPYDDIKIKLSVNDFIITTTEGTTYYFWDKEETRAKLSQGVNNIGPYISAWHLSREVSSDFLDTIEYYYHPIAYNDYLNTAQTQTTYSVPSNLMLSLNCATETQLSIPAYRINSLQLASMQNRNLRIYFNQDTSQRKDMTSSSYYATLSGIDVITNYGVLKNIRFKYEYFGKSVSQFSWDSMKLKLKEVAEYSLAGFDSIPKKPKKHVFYYENENDVFPSGYTKGIDIYGYYNGKDANISLVFDKPSGYLPFTCSQCKTNDRTPYYNYAKYGVLSEIVYPTGGSNKFKYEISDGPGIRIKEVTAYEPVTGNTTLKKSYEYSVNNKSTIEWLSGAQYHIYDRYDILKNSDVCLVGDNNITSNLNIIAGKSRYGTEVGSLFYYSKVNEYIQDSSKSLKTSNYFQVFGAGSTDITLTRSEVYSLKNNVYRLIDSKEYNYQIEQKENVFNLKSKVATILYNCDPHENVLQPYLATNERPYTQLKMYSGDIYFITSLKKKLVSTVHKIWDQDSTTYMEDKDNISYNQFSSMPNFSSTINSSGDNLTKYTLYPMDYCPCDLTSYNTKYQNTVNGIKTNYINCTNDRWACKIDNSTCYNKFPCESNAKTQMNTATVNYKNDRAASDNCVRGIWQYEPDSVKKGIYKLMSENKIGTPILQSDLVLKPNSNMYLVKNIFVTNYFPIESKGAYPYLYQYAGFNSPVEVADPSNVKGMNVPLENRLRVQYNSALQPKFSVTSGEVKNAYLWGYNNLRLVAKVSGTDYDTAISFVDPLVLQNPSSDQQLRNEINKIRTGLIGKKAVVTSYTYDPFIGITSECDVNNRLTYYEYDGFGRLKMIKDSSKNIIKLIDYQYQAGNGCSVDSCIGLNKRLINCTCETGTRVNTSSVRSGGLNWTCTYHYEWSDGFKSPDYSETNRSICPVAINLINVIKINPAPIDTTTETVVPGQIVH